MRVLVARVTRDVADGHGDRRRPTVFNEGGLDRRLTRVPRLARYCDPTVDRLEARAAVDHDRASRARAYRAIDRIVARDVPIVWLFNPTYAYAVRRRLAGFAPNAFVPTWNAYAWHLR